MNFVAWNVCGLSEMSRKELTGYCRRFRPIILGIIEPCTAFSRVRPSFWKDLQMIPIHQNAREISRSNIWIFSHNGLNVRVLLSIDQVVVVLLDFQDSQVTLAVVHSAACHSRRRDLWNSLLAFCTGTPFMMIGDFNVVKDAHERRSSVLPKPAACRDFFQFIVDANLIEPSTLGNKFT